MKKFLSLFLVLLLGLSLGACGNSKSAEKAIIGDWKSLEGAVTTFREDGTGTAPNGYDFNWKYAKDTKWYMLSLMGMTFSCEIKTENGIRYFEIEEIAYYHADDYEKAVEANK